MTLEEMQAHSFKNFHVRGFDYLCLKRTPEHTRKVYFFDGNVSQLPEVVSPHDHRYNFTTTVLTGVMSNSIYVVDEEYGQVYQEFAWDTPLNGGAGFTWRKETKLLETTRFAYRPGLWYRMGHDELHTIRMHAEGTVIVLDQYADCVPIGQPTRTFMQERQSPNLDGLYEKFTADELAARLAQYAELKSKLPMEIIA
ncbi:hypothetical protein [Mesorhizobium sp.]|uniref:hypothetical protein n=1 Tax=Mesorhizobium sp. TaxID=1871066 RepID=UPI000FE2CEC7|nr:hypothetical protein [Mesorhizobium sp.]RWI35533.1 MAG: hypothetical protein EOR14_28950 [Mesorhizobium sp.]RWJ03469.1 MAG: hypothetical protein EOR24_32330 [Mesorhizobium sp.]RWJ66298.1 MAG: hypothetical protein EOR34_28185 [Mesorhizobium sp.]